MSFERHGYTWDGAYTDRSRLQKRSGVYAVWCRTGESWSILDIGESHDVQERLLDHDREPQWKARCNGTLYFAATYTPGMQQAGRRQVEQRLRQIENPPCGDR